MLALKSTFLKNVLFLDQCTLAEVISNATMHKTKIIFEMLKGVWHLSTHPRIYLCIHIHMHKIQKIIPPAICAKGSLDECDVLSFITPRLGGGRGGPSFGEGGVPMRACVNRYRAEDASNARRWGGQGVLCSASHGVILLLGRGLPLYRSAATQRVTFRFLRQYGKGFDFGLHFGKHFSQELGFQHQPAS